MKKNMKQIEILITNKWMIVTILHQKIKRCNKMTKIDDNWRILQIKGKNKSPHDNDM